MEAVRGRVSLPIFRAKNPSLVSESGSSLARFCIQTHDPSPSTTNIPLLQKLLKAPLSRIKPTLDSEFISDSPEFPWASLLSCLSNCAPQKANLVRLHVLTAVMKCFSRRPPETKKALGDALAAGLSDYHQDVHDRALFYYRLLQHDVSVAERVVNPPKQAVSVFAETQSSETKDRIFDEFNSLSVLYQKPSYMFTDKEHRGPFAFSEELGNLSIGTESVDNVVAAQGVAANDKDLLLSTSEKEENQGYGDNGSAYNAPSYDGSTKTSASQAQLDLVSLDQLSTKTTASLAIDELLGLGIPVAPSPAPLPPALKLK